MANSTRVRRVDGNQMRNQRVSETQEVREGVTGTEERCDIVCTRVSRHQRHDIPGVLRDLLLLETKSVFGVERK